MVVVDPPLKVALQEVPQYLPIEAAPLVFPPRQAVLELASVWAFLLWETLAEVALPQEVVFHPLMEAFQKLDFPLAEFPVPQEEALAFA